MTQSSPLVSIIMPAFNADKYIEEAIDSVINQTYANWELLVINDGSTDSTAKIVEGFLSRDTRVQLYNNEENKGLCFTRNRGLQLAKGKYIANLDSDDIALPERLKIQVDFLESNQDFVLLGAACEVIDQEGKTEYTVTRNVAPSYLKSLLLFSNYFINSSVMYRAKESKALQYNPDYPLSEDYQFFVQLSEFGKIANLESSLVRYRVHGNNISAIKEKELEQAIHQIHKVLLEKLGIEAQSDELIMHASLVKESGKLSAKELQKVANWLERLRNQNHKRKVYPSQAFSHYCAFFFQRACLKSKAGLKSYLHFRNSSFYPDLNSSFKEKFTFFIKSILQIV